MSRLLLIDSRLSDIDAILTALTPNTEYIVFDYNADTFETLKTKISNGLTQYTHIAIAQHKYGISTYSLVASMPPALLYDGVDSMSVSVSDVEPNIGSWQPFVDFVLWMKQTVGLQYLDFLACNIWSDPNWVFVIQTLKRKCGVQMRASIDITGYGGNFILESDNADLVGVYFTEDIANYKYSFIGNDFITLINTKSPWGIYSASKFSNITNLLYELRGNGRNATTSGTFTTGSATGNGATGSIKFINGTTTSSMVWPSGSVPGTQTFAFITRYTNPSTNQYRILTSYNLSPNAFYGHHNYKRGVAYVNSNYLTSAVTAGTATDWVNMVVKTGGTAPNNVLLNGVACGTATNANGTTGTLTINSQTNFGPEYTDFGFSYLMIWDQALTDAEMVIVSNQLAFYLNTGNEPPVLTAFQSILNNKRPWGIYRALDWNSGTATLPEARGISGRNATSAGTITYNASDTGNGAIGVLASISGNTSSQMLWPAGSLPPTYTVALIDRMYGTNGRVLQVASNNVLFGHWGGGGNRGVYFEGSQFVNSTSYGTVTNWLPMVCKVGASPNNCIVDGVSRGTTSSAALGSADALRINAGVYGGESSSWSLSYVMVWDQALTDTEAAVVSTELLSYVSTGVLPKTDGFVLNGYFTGPVLSNNTYTAYTSPFSAIVNWTISTTNGLIYIANQSGAWGYSTLPAGITQWLVIQYPSTAGTTAVSQTIYFSTTGSYSLTYYTQIRPIDATNLITLGASINGVSNSSPVGVNNSWELRTLNFNITTTGAQTLTFNTSYNGGATYNAMYLSGINITQNVVTATISDPPTLNSATGGAKSGILVFTAPVSNGGSVITDYKYSLNGGDYTSSGSVLSPITITGLADNTTYTVSIVAVNAMGQSSASVTRSFTTVNYPSPPTLTSVTGGKLQLTVAFTDPSNNGGSAITNYLYSIDGGNTYNSGGVATSPLVINTGLVGDTTYSVVLKSVNALGSSITASNSLSDKVYDVVSQPTILVTTAYKSLVITDVSYASNGGSSATAYSYSIDGTNYTSTGATTVPISIPNLTTGNTYSVYVKVTNAYGLSIASSPVDMYASDYPAPPTITTIGSQDVSGSLFVAYTLPSYTGYNDITGWQFSIDNGVSFTTYSGDVSNNPLVLTGLINGNTYSVSLKATTVIGDSSASDVVTQKLVLHPDPPVILSCIPGVNQFTMSWTAPTYTGYDTITNYSYSLNGGEYVYLNTTTSPITITGLTHQPYVVQLRAHNSMYASVASTSVTVTPYLAPDAPVITGFTFGAQTLNAQFTVNTNDASLTAITYSVNGAPDISANAVTSPLSIPNLVEGVTYSVSIKAYNAGGVSPYSDISCVYLPYSFANTKSPLSISSNGEMFVMTVKNAVNNNYNYKYSYDGVNWTSATFPTPSNPSGIKWMGNQFQVVGNAILKSADGVDFSLQNTTISPSLTNTTDIECKSDQPHAIEFPLDTTLLCSVRQVAHSVDGGFSWSAPVTVFTDLSDTIQSAVWMGTQWVVVATTHIATSADGVSWRIAPAPVSQPKSIAWNASAHTLVVVGRDGVASSSDGVFWISLGKLGMDVGESVSWNGGKWVVYGTLSTQSVLVESPDAMWWSAPQNTVFPATFSPIIYNQTQYLCIDGSANLTTSPDGVTWFTGTSPFQTHTAVAWNASTTGVTRIQPLCLALGSSTNHTMAVSVDGIFWNGLGKQVLSDVANDAVWTGQFWVAVGSSASGTGAWCARSMDGLNWQGSPDRVFAEGVCVAWNGAVVLAVGNTGNIAVSVDGLEWEHVYGLTVSTNAKVIWTGRQWAIFATAGIYITTNVYGNGGWQHTNHVYSFAGGVVQTPWEIYVQSSTSPQLFSKYDVTTMSVLDASVNVATVNAPVTTCCYDGSWVLVGCANGVVGTWNEEHFETQMIASSASSISICYNNMYSVIGEMSGNSWYGQTPNWQLGYNLPITHLKKVVSNSKYNVVYTPNTIYMNAGAKLQITTPKYLTVPQTVVNIDLLRNA